MSSSALVVGPVASKCVRFVRKSISLCRHFSPAVSNDANRHTFVSNIVDVYTQYCLDGIDIDWEYPGQQGESSNTVSPSDTANFLSFLQLLRAKLPSVARITAATQTVPFAGANGSPLADVGDFASVLDWVLLMNYDTWGCECRSSPFVRPI